MRKSCTRILPIITARTRTVSEMVETLVVPDHNLPPSHLRHQLDSIVTVLTHLIFLQTLSFVPSSVFINPCNCLLLTVTEATQPSLPLPLHAALPQYL